MTEEAAIGENQTAESAQAEQAAQPTNDLYSADEYIAAQNKAAAESALSEDEHIGVNAEPLVTQAERDVLLEEPVVDAVLTLPCPLTLEQYLRLELNAVAAHTTIEYRTVARKNAAGDVTFYIHPSGQDGMSRDFAVMGELARNITKLTA